MKTYLAAYYDPEYYEPSAFFWGAVIFLAVFVVCFFIWKAFEWVRSRAALRGGKESSQPETTKDSWDQAISRPAADCNYVSLMGGGSEFGGLEGMSEREQEYFFATYGPRKVRKEMKKRLLAREQKERDRST